MHVTSIKNVYDHFNADMMTRILKEASWSHIAHNFVNYIRHEELLRKQNSRGLLAPTTTYLEIVTYCPRDCFRCYVPEEERKDKELIWLSVLDKIMRKSEDMGIRLYAVIGGETITQSTAPILRYLLKNHGQNTFSIPTNGDYLSRNAAAIEDIITRDCFNIAISVDGMLKETHESIRGKGSFESATKSMRILHDYRRMFGCVTTVRPENHAEVTDEAFIDWAVSHGSAYITYAFTDELSEEQSKKILSNLEKHSDKPIFIYTSLFGHLGVRSRNNFARALNFNKQGCLFDTRKNRQIIGTIDDDVNELTKKYQWVKKFMP